MIKHRPLSLGWILCVFLYNDNLVIFHWLTHLTAEFSTSKLSGFILFIKLNYKFVTAAPPLIHKGVWCICFCLPSEDWASRTLCACLCQTSFRLKRCDTFSSTLRERVLFSSQLWCGLVFQAKTDRAYTSVRRNYMYENSALSCTSSNQQSKTLSVLQ